MNRRTFLIRTSAAATVAACSGIAKAADAPAELHLSPIAGAAPLPLTYTGLSYELAQLSEPEFFSAANKGLIAHFKLLSPHGVLRIGGNSSEFCWFAADVNTPAPKLHVPPGDINANWMPHRLFKITPQAVDNLAEFLQATGWRVIYGINYGNNTPERAAVEAAYVYQKLGDKLEYFQIGNEPDLYRTPTNGTRPPGWDFDDYVREWVEMAKAVLAKVPQAKFGGPDVAGSSDWVVRFGERVPELLPGKLASLSGHYYAEGPPNDPKVTIERLLRPTPKVAADMDKIEAIAKPRGLRYRMTEGNSCYRGGKPGMSDAFASALWAGSYMLELAVHGCSGVNFHGGVASFLNASLGDHAPGYESAMKPQAKRGGYYTPIDSEPGRPVKAMPIFYGMMMANQLAGGTLLNADLQTGSVNATAFAAQHGKVVKVAVFNKDAAAALDLTIHTPREFRSARVWRLKGPALDATEGITLDGAEIEQNSAEWEPHNAEEIQTHGDSLRIPIPEASGALLSFS